MVRSLPTGVGTPKPPHALYSEIGDKVIAHVRFSNRPFGVKRFQTIHHHSVDVAHGLATSSTSTVLIRTYPWRMLPERYRPSFRQEKCATSVCPRLARMRSVRRMRCRR